MDYSLAATRSHSYQMVWLETNERGVIQFWNQSSELCLEIIVVVTASYSLFYDPSYGVQLIEPESSQLNGRVLEVLCSSVYVAELYSVCPSDVTHRIGVST